jgi:uncharacterized repeat protein (TIGR03833 family)
MVKSGKYRENLQVGLLVDVVLKKDQPTGELTRGHIAQILTKSDYHPHGQKVMLMENHLVGRVKLIIQDN